MHSTVESYWTVVLNLFFLLLMLSWKVFQGKRTSAWLFVTALLQYWKIVAMCLLFSMLKISLSFWKSFNFLYYAVHLPECILDNHCPFKKCEGQKCTHITNTICDGHTCFKAFQNDNGLSAGMAQCWFLYSFPLITNTDFFLKQDKPGI